MGEGNQNPSYQVAIIIFCISAMYLTEISHIKLKSVEKENANVRYQIAIILRLSIFFKYMRQGQM